MIAKFGAFEYALAHRYRFRDVLGRGGMGTVYHATDVRLGRSVAIKMLHAALTSEIGIRRFEAEIRITAALHHPNITVVHDCGEVDGHLYYVMEHLGGESLRARLDRVKRLSIPEAVTIADHVAAGLQHAHAGNVVHRDIKPENIILTDDRACIVDFGLARIINDAGSRRLTESGLVVGTPQYLSPEQAGAEKEIGPGADQYALACVLFEMLAGRPPFSGATPAAIATHHVKDPPPSLAQWQPDAPAALSDAIARGLRKSAADRFDDVASFAMAASVTLRSDADASSAVRASRRGR